MAEIGKYARGLPSLLDLRVQGQGPREFSEQVVGTVDVTLNYLLQGRETLLTGNAGAPVLGFNSYTVPVRVPANELWYVWEYYTGTIIGAGAAIAFAPACNFDGIAGFALSTMVGGVATEGIWQPANRPFWAAPGSELGFLCKSVTLAPVLAGAYLVTKLRL